MLSNMSWQCGLQDVADCCSQQCQSPVPMARESSSHCHFPMCFTMPLWNRKWDLRLTTLLNCIETHSNHPVTMLRTTCFSGRCVELKQLRICSVPVVKRQQMQKSLTYHTLKAHKLWRAARRQLRGTRQRIGAANACIAVQAAAAANMQVWCMPALPQ